MRVSWRDTNGPRKDERTSLICNQPFNIEVISAKDGKMSEVLCVLYLR